MILKNEQLNNNELKWFLLGLGLGVTAGFLVAPKSGSDTRKYMQDKANEGADYLKNESTGVMNAGVDLLDRGAKAIRHQKENVAAAVEAGQAAYRDALASTPSIKVQA